MSFAAAAALLRTDRISAVASRSDDYGGFRRRMGDAAIAQQDLGASNSPRWRSTSRRASCGLNVWSQCKIAGGR